MKIAKIKDWILQLSLALIIFFGFLRPYVIEAFRIPTPSMEGTMLVGDHLLVLKVSEGQQIPWTDRMRPLLHWFRGDEYGLLMPATSDPEVGEVLIFKYPAEPGKDFVKRMVAAAGDTVRVSGDTLYVNGEPSEDWSFCYQDGFEPCQLDQSWPDCLDRLYGGVQDLAYWEIRDNCIMTEGVLAYVVPEDHVFMMGDNRDHSSDSRVWGALPVDLIKGEALVTYWSWVPGHGLPKFDRIARLIR
ncbi:MAG: signal peptidase I [Candidatus Aegiribacteria sp.]|nr:signal peptidase I [Candidatus Aegiribacteria sp.]